MNLRRTIYRTLLGWGVAPGDEYELRTRKYLLVNLTLFLSMGMTLWTLVLMGLGLWAMALVPAGYLVLSGINLFLFRWTKHLRRSLVFQLSISLLMPFLLQWLLGGYATSGVVTLWAILAPVGAVMVGGSRSVWGWVLAFSLLCVVSWWIEPHLPAGIAEVLSPGVSRTLFLFNLILVIPIIFRLAVIGVRREEKVDMVLNRTMQELTESMKLLSLSQEEITMQSEVIEHNAQLLANKNEELEQSMRYASRLQGAIMAGQKYMPYPLREMFVFNRPRDLVSGDFFWVGEVRSKTLIVVGDCTGHGVPGALLTMLGCSLLDQIVVEFGVNDPEKVLYILNKRWKKLLTQSKQLEFRMPDTVDLGVCVIDFSQQEVSYAGGFHRLVHVREGVLTELKGNRKSVGSVQDHDMMAWKKQTFNYAVGDTVYMYTDGFQDQFGGPDNRKYLSKRFKKLLVEQSRLPMAEQEERLKEEFVEWVGQGEQTDDVLVVGFRL